jgi:hypothetical protein
VLGTLFQSFCLLKKLRGECRFAGKDYGTTDVSDAARGLLTRFDHQSGHYQA